LYYQNKKPPHESVKFVLYITYVYYLLHFSTIYNDILTSMFMS